MHEMLPAPTMLSSQHLIALRVTSSNPSKQNEKRFLIATCPCAAAVAFCFLIFLSSVYSFPLRLFLSAIEKVANECGCALRKTTTDSPYMSKIKMCGKN